MDCNEARPLLDASADHELPAPDALRVQQHIDNCDACRRESEGLHALSQTLRAAPYHRAPESLRARIVGALPSTQDAGADAIREERRPTTAAAGAGRRRWLVWLDGWRRPQDGWGGLGVAAGSNRVMTRGGLAALAVALCAVTAGVTLSLHKPAAVAPFADELVESHVRAQMSGHDIDVISTDRHTVKPWFNGRLDYTPPVEDLAASGFALEGGRLDYLAHQRVAVLVYRYQKHVIDVYVFPQTSPAAASLRTGGTDAQTVSREGFSMSRWNAEGMTWWAITDAAPDALGGLERALKARLAAGSERTEGGS
jgi:anti-sigma factor RsiW